MRASFELGLDVIAFILFAAKVFENEGRIFQVVGHEIQVAILVKICPGRAARPGCFHRSPIATFFFEVKAALVLENEIADFEGRDRIQVLIQGFVLLEDLLTGLVFLHILEEFTVVDVVDFPAIRWHPGLGVR